MSVVVSCQDVGPCRKEVKIEVPAPAVEAETQRVVREFAKKTRLSGFRKGKVPASLVKRRFRAEIDQEVLERLLPRYWRQAEAEASLEPLMAPRIGDDVKLEDGEPLVFVATVEVRPEIEVSEDRQFQLPSPEVDVAEEEIDEAIERLRQDVAPWRTAERPAVRGDQVRLRLWPAGEEPGEAGEAASDVTASDEPAPEKTGEQAPEETGEQAGASAQEVTIELGDERVWEELTLAVTGLAADQRGRFTRREAPAEPPDADEEAAAPPQMRDFELEVLEVQEKELPEVDDDLAKKIGEFDDVEALREALGKRLRLEKLAARSHEREERLTEQLLERHPLELPEAVIDQEVRSMLEDYAEGLARRGVDLQKTQLDWDAMAQQARPQARRRVHRRLVLDAIAEHDRVEVSAEELERALSQLAKAQGQTTVALRQSLAGSGRLDAMRQHMRRDKILKRLLGEEPEPAEESPSDDDSEE